MKYPQGISDRREFLGLLGRTALAGAWLACPAMTWAANPATNSASTGTPEPWLVCPARAAVGQAFELRVENVPPRARVFLDWDGARLELFVDRGLDPVGPANEPGLAQELVGLDLTHMSGTAKAQTWTATRDLAVSLESVSGARTFRQKVEIIGRAYPQERLNLPEAMVTPPSPAVEERTRVEREAVARILAQASARRLWTLPLLRPVDGVILSPYGLRRVLNNKPKAPHRGLDFRGAVGTPVQACAQGQVVLAAEHYYSGRSVYLDHGGGVFSMYFHLSEISVKEGETVGRGTVLGAVGASGRATGPHLHLGLRVPGGLVDPAPLLG